MKKCVVMFASVIAALSIAVYTDDDEHEILDNETLLGQNIQGADLAHQNDTELESVEGVSSYLYLEEDE